MLDKVDITGHAYFMQYDRTRKHSFDFDGTLLSADDLLAKHAGSASLRYITALCLCLPFYDLDAVQKWLALYLYQVLIIRLMVNLQ